MKNKNYTGKKIKVRRVTFFVEDQTMYPRVTSSIMSVHSYKGMAGSEKFDAGFFLHYLAPPK